MTQVLIADDHEIIRDGLRGILEATPGLMVAGEVANGHEVLAALNVGLPDVLLLDFSMPGMSGFDLIKRIRGEFPDLPILVLTMHTEEQYAVRAIRAGASGYVSKGIASAQLIMAIRQVADGRPYISTVVAEQLAMAAMPGHTAASHGALSDRELQIFELLVAGQTVSGIGRSLNISAKTVGAHKSRIFDKLQINSVAQLVRYAIGQGLVSDCGSEI